MLVRDSLGYVLWKIKYRIQQYPKVQKLIIQLIEKVPFAGRQLRRLMYITSDEVSVRGSNSIDEMSHDATLIFDQIKHRIIITNKEKGTLP